MSVWQPNPGFAAQIKLRRFDNFARLDAASAYFHPAIAAGRKLNANRLQIRIETSPGLVVSVGNVVSKLRTFSAYVASLCHKNYCLQKKC
jgi:hypothetical protein